MKALLQTLLFIFVISVNSFAQDNQENPKHVKTTWTGNGFFHAGFRPGNWEMDQFGAVQTSNGVDKNGVQGSPTQLYLAIEQMGRFFYWDMDLSMMLSKKNYEFTDSRTAGYFVPETQGTYQTAQASFMGSVGYLWKGRMGIYVGGRVGYDNTLLHYTSNGASLVSYMPELGGPKKGYNFHFFFPFIRGMVRVSFFTDIVKKDEFNFKAKEHETEINYCIPFNKKKNFGLMLKYNHMGYTTTDYLGAFKTLNAGAEISFKRSYFQIGVIIPVIRELSPDECVDCRGRGYRLEKGPPCTVCGGSGSVKCTFCNGQGLIVNETTKTCTRCGGSGKVNCSACAGLGTTEFGKRSTCETCGGTGKKKK